MDSEKVDLSLYKLDAYATYPIIGDIKGFKLSTRLRAQTFILYFLLKHSVCILCMAWIFAYNVFVKKELFL